MAIQRKPKTSAEKEKAVMAYIQGAPDAAASTSDEYEKGVKKGNRRQVTITMAPDLLRRVDEAAKRSGMSRNAVISMATHRMLEEEVL